MTTRYTVDRIEEGGWAVLEGPEGAMLELPSDWLPPDAGEGSRLLVSTEGEGDERRVLLTHDPEETETRRSTLQDRRDRMRGRDPGDLTL